MKKLSGILLSTIFLFFSTYVLALPPFVPGQIVVKGQPSETADYEVLKELPNADLQVLKVGNGRELAMAQSLRKKGVRASLNYIAHKMAEPTDPLFDLQWHMKSINVASAWDINKGENVVIAVLDTGLVHGLPDGVSLCEGLSERDVVAGDNDASDGSSLSHGTHVSGTIAQNTSFTGTGTGVTGVAPAACILPVKVLDDSGSGTFADIAEGIVYAVNAGADIINMSLGVSARYGLTNDSSIDPALNAAEQAGVLVVAAAGNDGYRNNVSYPAIYPSVVAVGATDALNNLSRYSNRGYGLDIVAPGGDTGKDRDGDGYVDGVLQETQYNGGSGYYFLQGTSMASPHVAGVAALILSNTRANQPEPSAQDLRSILFSSTLDLGDPGFDSVFGHGLIQADLALGLGDNGGAPPTEPPAECIDSDMDGYCAVLDGATYDCDDENVDVYPGHPDRGRWWGSDGVDNDCDGVADK